MGDLELTKPETILEQRVRRSPPLTRNVCASAIDHLRRAWLIRETDPEMAVFRCITAEEEAVAAIFLSLRRHGYADAKRLQWHSHRQKAVVLPFLQSTAETFRLGGGALPASVVYEEVDGAFQFRVRFLTTADDGTPLALHPQPPLHATADVEGQVPDILPKMLELVGGAGLDRLKQVLADRTNKRNTLLYASEKGLPRYVGSVDTEIARHRANVFALLTFFVLIDEHPTVQGLVQQALAAFMSVLDALHPPKQAPVSSPAT